MSKEIKYKENLLSDFIDTLNEEKKPRFDLTDAEDYLDELEALFETVRAVKRLKKEELKRPSSTYGMRFYKSSISKKSLSIAVVAAVFISILAGIWHLGVWNKSGNIVYAMVEAYEQLDSYKGVMEFSLQNKGDIMIKEKREITYQKPNKFHVVTTIGERIFTKIYDGKETMISFHGDETDQMIVDYMSEELLQFFLEDYHICTHIYELK